MVSKMNPQNVIHLINDVEYVHFTKKEVCEIIYEFISDSIDHIIKNILQMSYEDFEEFFEDLIEEYIRNVRENINEGIELYESELREIHIISIKLVYKYIIPPRSYQKTFITKSNVNKVLKIKKKLAYLQNIPQPDQRTEEWYNFRHNRLTATAIHKIFFSPATVNALILEKSGNQTIKSNSGINIDTALHWGQKYEPLTSMYYEYVYNTKIRDYGCIPHPEYDFLAASPDGINDDPTNERYGRMLEIKNIYNREITGIPKMEYWIQMQIQMETCDLNECDFIETRFKEFETREMYLNDTSEYKGLIVQFEKDNKPEYEYHAFGYTTQEIDEWRNNLLFDDRTWIKDIYWRLDEVSCILVLRNKLWFNTAIPYIKDVWQTILNEKKYPTMKRKENLKLKEKAYYKDEELKLILNGVCHISLN